MEGRKKDTWEKSPKEWKGTAGLRPAAPYTLPLLPGEAVPAIFPGSIFSQLYRSCSLFIGIVPDTPLPFPKNQKGKTKRNS